MKAIFLSSTNYTDHKTENYGDCILVDTGTELIIYDCGSEAHAERILDYMNSAGYNRAKLILSHNDSDHFDGIPKLIEAGAVSDIYTLLLLKYLDDLVKRINDKRIKKESLKLRIADIFNNIYSLRETVPLHDMFEETSICDGVDIVGPDKNYTLDAVAKRIDNREGDTIDNETIVNAISCQAKVKFGSTHLLLCGDSNYEAIKDKLTDYKAVQLPHHGKYDHASKIMADMSALRTSYFVSDNTGNTNGGSDELMKHRRGYKIYNTKDGDQIYTAEKTVIIPRRTLGAYK